MGLPAEAEPREVWSVEASKPELAAVGLRAADEGEAESPNA